MVLKPETSGTKLILLLDLLNYQIALFEYLQSARNELTIIQKVKIHHEILLIEQIFKYKKSNYPRIKDLFFYNSYLYTDDLKTALNPNRYTKTHSLGNLST
jgi:hypothetical protein